MRAIDQPGLRQFAPKGLDWQDLSGGGGGGGGIRRCHILNIYGLRRFYSIIHGAILIPRVWPVLTPGA